MYRPEQCAKTTLWPFWISKPGPTCLWALAGDPCPVVPPGISSLLRLQAWVAIREAQTLRGSGDAALHRGLRGTNLAAATGSTLRRDARIEPGIVANVAELSFPSSIGDRSHSSTTWPGCQRTARDSSTACCADRCLRSFIVVLPKLPIGPAVKQYVADQIALVLLSGLC